MTRAPDDRAPQRVLVGALAGAFGVRGEVRLKSFCAEPEAIADYAPLYAADGRRFAEVILTGHAKAALTARVDGIATKEQADALRGTELYADRDRLPPPEEDEFYHADLIGLAVHDTGGALIGEVRAVHDHGAGDLLEVAGPSLSGTVLIPFTREIVPTVDIGAGRLVIDPPPGLMPDPQADPDGDPA